jgi:hypothetical protein
VRFYTFGQFVSVATNSSTALHHAPLRHAPSDQISAAVSWPIAWIAQLLACDLLNAAHGIDIGVELYDRKAPPREHKSIRMHQFQSLLVQGSTLRGTKNFFDLDAHFHRMMRNEDQRGFAVMSRTQASASGTCIRIPITGWEPTDRPDVSTAL